MTGQRHEFDRAPEGAPGAPAGEGYLWDGSGPADADVQRLEIAGDAARWRGGPVPVVPGRAGASTSVARRPRLMWLSLAAAAVTCVAGAGAWLALRGDGVGSATWQVSALEGAPRVGSDVVTDIGTVRAGQWLTTDSASRASLNVATIGRVTLEPDSRLRVLASLPGEHRVELAQGKIGAFIAAPPRLFFVETPSALAVDLGCIYTLEVAPDGSGMLDVRTGLVELQRTAGVGGNGRDGASVSRVLAGAVCRIDAKLGPGVPRERDAGADLASAVGVLERASSTGRAGGDGAARAVSEVVRVASEGDAQTIWHLMWRVDDRLRAPLADALARLVPVPGNDGVAPALSLDGPFMDRWWQEIAARR